MIRFNRHALTGASALAMIAAAAPAPVFAQTSQDGATASEGDQIVVTGLAISRDEPASATGLALTLRQTPQSVTVIDNQRIQDFGLTNTGILLEQVVGLNVQRYDSDRTMFTARGFDVSNVQVDGIGTPLRFNIQFGEMDTLFFERIEVIRGASGLTTGVGNPSATINYIRKRPTRERGLMLGAYYGSYNNWRVEADGNVLLDDDGDFALRVVGAHEMRDSHMIHYDNKRSLAGATLSAAITPDLKATVGYTYQYNLSHGSGWSSVVHHYSDGTLIDNDRSANFAPPWAYWWVVDEQAFAELAWSIGKWTVKGVYTMKRADEEQALLYVGYGNPDRTTGLGFNGYSGRYQAYGLRHTADLHATGPFMLFGREHDLMMGVSWTREDVRQWEAYALPTPFPIAIPDFRNFANAHVPRPDFETPRRLEVDEPERQIRGYIASRLNFTDWLKVLGGTSYVHYKKTGVYYGAPTYRENKKFNPYIGVLVDPLPNVTIYGSYTTTFNPQGEVDVSRVRLPPIEGTNLEAGVKAELLDRRLFLSAVLFRTRQNNIAQYAGDMPGYSYYEPVDNTAEGFEIEVAGHITPVWQVSGGYTGLRIKDNDGNATRTYQPRQSLKLSTNYRFVDFNNLTIGAQGRWQGDTFEPIITGTVPAGTELRQNAYVVLDLMAGIDLSEGLRATLNVRNVTDTKYITSMAAAAYDMGNFAPGRNFTVSLTKRF